MLFRWHQAALSLCIYSSRPIWRTNLMSFWKSKDTWSGCSRLHPQGGLNMVFFVLQFFFFAPQNPRLWGPFSSPSMFGHACATLWKAKTFGIGWTRPLSWSGSSVRPRLPSSYQQLPLDGLGWEQLFEEGPALFSSVFFAVLWVLLSLFGSTRFCLVFHGFIKMVFYSGFISSAKDPAMQPNHKMSGHFVPCQFLEFKSYVCVGVLKSVFLQWILSYVPLCAP